jgi:anti-anti-sigma factor
MAPFDDLEALPTVEAEEPAPRTLLLRVRGELDAVASGRLAAVFDEELADGGFSRILIDLSRVTLLATAALTVLQRLRWHCRKQQMHLVLVGTGRPAVHRPLRTTGVLPLFDTRATLQAALLGHTAAARRSASR